MSTNKFDVIWLPTDGSSTITKGTLMNAPDENAARRLFAERFSKREILGVVPVDANWRHDAPKQFASKAEGK